MPIKVKNLSGFKDIQGGFGEEFYLVDDNYRTVAQGWARPDRTGPIDLWSERNPGYVFRNGDYSSDAVAAQAAIDAMIDFRGDILYFSPGAFSWGAVVTMDVPGARLLGRKTRGGRTFHNQITTTVANGLTITGAADELEVGYLKFIPTTAQVTILVNGNARGMWWHDWGWDATGVAASTSTIGLNHTGASTDALFEDFYWCTDAAQGPLFQVSAAISQWELRGFTHCHTTGTYVTSLLDLIAGSAGVGSIRIGPGVGQIAGGGTVTQLVNAIDLTGVGTKLTVASFLGSVGYATATTLVANTANDCDHLNSYIATIPAGAGGALYTS